MAQTVSLVLGSGGARGYAHIGVIDVLLEKGYDIRSIAGSSMGALIGGLYAGGKLEAYKKWVLTLDMLDVAKLIDFSLGKSGMIQGEKVFKVIQKMIGDVRIEELKIPFTAVATDIIKEKEVWLQKGSLLDAIRASIAIPTIFTPKIIENRYLIDGGILNPLPIAPTLSDMTDITIAVRLNAQGNKDYTIHIPDKEVEKEIGIRQTFFDLWDKAGELFADKSETAAVEMGIFDIMGHVIDTMQNALTECKMAGYNPDIMIDIPKESCGFHEFNKAYELIELGKVVASKTLDEYRAKTASLEK
jgi:NTE family protein